MQKALRSLERGRYGLNADPGEALTDRLDDDALLAAAVIATPDRPFQLEAALRRGMSVDEVASATRVDPWFLDQILRITEERTHLAEVGLEAMRRPDWRRAKRLGFSDAQLAYLWSCDEATVRVARLEAGVQVTYKTVDTCAAEFRAETPYHYSTYEDSTEVEAGDRPKVVILGSGPNRIGQGIEFDYCCVHASFALRDAGYETIMVNCNPETVSTDYDTSDRLYFEPITYEDVMNVIEAEQASAKPGSPGVVGVIVALGGQTPLKLAGQLPPELVLGTSPASIDAAEDRERWNALCAELDIPQPPGGTATTLADARAVVAQIDYPVLMRPSYVLGGRAMEIVYDDDHLERAMDDLAGFGALHAEGGVSAERPVLIDRFLEDATEVDVDAIRDHTGDVVIGGVMEHVEEAGVHSGDSACALPPYSLGDETIAVIEGHVRHIAEALDVRGLINVQFAVRRTEDGGDEVYVIEANPRASRTVPFVAKATGVVLVKVATRVMAGATLAELRAEGLLQDPVGGHVAVKEAVLPFNRFPGADRVLGPEMHSTGEVMGVDATFGLAFAKSQIAAGDPLPESGAVFLSLANRDKDAGVRAASIFAALGFEIAATAGTAAALEAEGIDVAVTVAKLGEPSGVDAVELIESGRIQLVVNSPRGRGPRADGAHIRAAAGVAHVPCLTTGAAALAAATGMHDWSTHELQVRNLQELLDPLPLPRPRDVPWRRPDPNLSAPVDLATRVGTVRLPTPFMTASGTAGHATELGEYVDLAALGAFVTKSVASFPYAGNPAPRVHETPAGMLNSVGLQGPGVERWLQDDLPLLRSAGVRRIVVSIWGRSIEEYRAAALLLAKAPDEVVAVEVNLSCPNTEAGRSLFAHDPDVSGAVIEACRDAAGRPVWAKLSPNTDRLVEVATAVRRAGADAVTLVNTVLGMVIDVEARRPLLGGGGGGLSGAAMHPVAVRAVYDVHAALPDLPIVGVGGVDRVEAAVELLLAGAAAVQVGTAAFFDPRCITRLTADLEHWCRRHRVATIDELIGGAHG